MGTIKRALSGRGRALLAAACGALLALTTLAAPASAGEKPETFRFHETDTHIEQDEHEGWCPEVPFLVEFTGDFVFFFKAMTRGKDGLAYFSSNGRLHDSYTNLENGRTFTVRVVWHDSDVRVVDNGDGTLGITFATQVSSALTDPDGNRVDQGAGRVEFQVIVDHNGTPSDPEDDELVSESLTRVSGHPFHYYLDRDICQDALDMLS
jgi:hypothetical protein